MADYLTGLPDMILLLGGTSDTAAIATGLAQAGYRVLVSTATDEPLHIGKHRYISHHTGRLDETAMTELVRIENIHAIVDATHPYAAAAHSTASAVAKRLELPYFSFLRPSTVDAANPNVHFAATHEAAARLAFSFGKGVLLTTGANHLSPYVEWSRKAHLPLAVRVLLREDSRQACLHAGISAEQIIQGKGPFGIAENRQHIRQYNMGVLVTKDSGRAGGVEEKLQAALLENCHVVVLQRPTSTAPAVTSVDELLASVERILSLDIR